MKDFLKAAELALGGGGMLAAVGGGVAMVLGFNRGFLGVKYGLYAFAIGVGVKIFRRLLLPD